MISDLKGGEVTHERTKQIAKPLFPYSHKDLAADSAPRAMSTKSEFPMSIKTKPTVSVRLAASARAALLRTKPSSVIADSTFRRVRSATRSGLLSTFETVPIATPARRATS